MQKRKILPDNAAMTEAEWHACNDPRPMLEFVGGCASERKLRLLCCACARRVWHLLEANSLRRAVDALECYADTAIDAETFQAAASQTHPMRVYYYEVFDRRQPPHEATWLPAYGINCAIQALFDHAACATLDDFARAISAAEATNSASSPANRSAPLRHFLSENSSATLVGESLSILRGSLGMTAPS